MEKQNKQAKLERKIKYYTENTLTHRKESTGERIIRLTIGSMKVPLFKAELKGIKEGKAQAISEFKEKLKERIEKDFPFSANKMSKIIEKTAQELTK